MQGFIQPILLMSVFERRLSLRMLYFVKNDFKIVLQCPTVSGGSENFAAGPWRRPSAGSIGKDLKMFSFFTSGGSTMA